MDIPLSTFPNEGIDPPKDESYTFFENPEKLEIRLLDVFRLDSSYRIVARSSQDFNKFVLISTATGESSSHMSARRLKEYLCGRNRLRAHFVKYGNLDTLLQPNLENHSTNIAHIWIS